jgi:hypothetical protein
VARGREGHATGKDPTLSLGGEGKTVARGLVPKRLDKRCSGASELQRRVSLSLQDDFVIVESGSFLAEVGGGRFVKRHRVTVDLPPVVHDISFGREVVKRIAIEMTDRLLFEVRSTHLRAALSI